MKRRHLLRLGGATLAATASAGCSSVGGSEGVRVVSMTDGYGFGPGRLTVGSGTTVRWVNDSSVGHTVTAYADRIPTDAQFFASGGFDSERAARNDVRDGLVPTDEAYEHTFETRGTYEYYCIPHESSGMTGTVVVR